MAVKIEAQDGEFVAVVRGLKVTGPVLAEILEQIRDGLDKHLVLVIPGSDLDDDAFVEFGRGFGEVEDFSIAYGSNKAAGNVTNLDPGKRVPRAPDDPFRVSIAGDALWHTDSSYRPYRARYSMLVARTVPKSGGETQFCDTRGAYDALPEATKRRIEGLTAIHSIIHSRKLVGYDGWTEEQRAALPPASQPLVLVNPSTGRRSIYLASHICGIEGWDEAEAGALIQGLTEFATQPRFVHQHAWSVGDIVIWDDRATMHRRMPYDDLNEARELTTVRVVDLPEARRAVV